MNIYGLILRYKYFIEIQTSDFSFVPTPYFILSPKMNSSESQYMIGILNALLYYKLLNNNNFVQTKYGHLKECFANPFINAPAKLELVVEFSRIQRAYFVLYRFVQMCKWKKAKVHINTDLYMTELDPSCKRTFKILQHGKIYYFSVTDIVKIIRGTLINSSYMFTLPLRAKNPYNNIEFGKADLYNMYFKLKSVLLTVPSIIETYFRYNFDVYKLKKYHETDLICQAITHNVYNSWDTDYLHSVYLEMVNMMNMKNKIRVHKDYPLKLLINAMKPYLELYMLCKYVSNRVLQHNYECELRYRLNWFHYNNPTFGRKIYKTKRKKGVSYVSTITFNNVNPNSKQLEKPDFMRTHLYAEYKYNSFIYRGYFNSKTSYDTSYSNSSSESDSSSSETDTRIVSESENDTETNDSNEEEEEVTVIASESVINYQFSFPFSRVNSQIYHTIRTDTDINENDDAVVIQNSDSDTETENDAHEHPSNIVCEHVESDTDTVPDYGSDTWSYNHDEDYDW